jgi:hypothetical protein
MVALGAPTGAGIPLALTVKTPPALTITKSGANVTVSWPADASGYTLESTSSVGAPTWTAVPNVTGNSVVLPASAATQFYRLRN